MTADQRIHELIIRSRLSALWVFVLINMLLQDLHELLRAGQLEEMISGVVNGTRVTEELLLVAGIVLECRSPWSFSPLCSRVESHAGHTPWPASS
jgi:hypothetical protein